MHVFSSSMYFGIAAAFAALAIPMTAMAGQGQTSPCPDPGRSDRPSHCEIREFVVPAVGNALAVDASPNGGIAVHGWNRQDVQIRAKVVATAETQQEADALASQVKVVTDGGRIRSEGPRAAGGESGWSVSFDLMVPMDGGLDLQSKNGGISLADVRGRIDFAATNGGISLKNVNGDVRGHTTNGGVKVELAGDRWQGHGLDVQTVNGGVSLLVPDGYSAHVEAGTRNGGLKCEFPITVQGTLNTELATDLGQGGAPIKVRTTNGGVAIGKK
jgi:DUF4097 and DUF4098 domain-containing protein YvlB